MLRSLDGSIPADDRVGTLDQRAFWLRVYALVGDLLVHGPRVSGLEPLRALLDSADLPVDGNERSPEGEGRHLVLEIHDAAFLDVGTFVSDGTASPTLVAAHAALGLPLSTDRSSDHLGRSLRLMATLLDAEFEAMTHGDHEEVETLRRWQTRVLDDALLPWMPPLLAALSGQPPSLWTRALEMAARALASHRATDPSLPNEVGGGEVVFLHDLTALVEALSTPRYCGAYLSRRDLASVARRCGISPGFGSREDMLELMLAHAVGHGTLPHLTTELIRLLAERDDALASLASNPGLAMHVPAWRRRVAMSRTLLERFSSTAEVLRGAS